MDDKKMGVYQIINNVNRKTYIGYSSDIINSYNTHKRTSTGKSQRKRYLYQEMELYGKENFSLEILVECDTQQKGLELKNAFIEGHEPEYNGNKVIGGKTFQTSRTKKKREKPRQGKQVIGIKHQLELPSAREAARAAGCTRGKVLSHCNKTLKNTKYEFVFKDVK